MFAFGGTLIILVWYLGQLPLVIDKAIYSCEGQVKELWKSFTIVVILDTMFMKIGQKKEQKHLCHLLTNVGDAILTVDDLIIIDEPYRFFIG